MRPARRGPRIPTRLLLLGGVIGPIVFGSTVLVEGATRPGYDPVRQFVSVLSLGNAGWVQAANFVVAGLLIIGFGIGLGRRSGDGPGRWAPWLMLLTGVALIVSGLFPADPQWGYPAWISAEAVANPTLHARIHLAAGFVATAAFSLVMLAEARRAMQTGAPARTVHALASLAIMLGCFLTGLAVEPPGSGFPWAGVLQRAGLLAGLQWLTWFAASQLRAASERSVAARVIAESRRPGTRSGWRLRVASVSAGPAARRPARCR